MKTLNQLAADIVDTLIVDLEGRKGLGDIYGDCTSDIQQEIRATWERKVAAILVKTIG